MQTNKGITRSLGLAALLTCSSALHAAASLPDFTILVEKNQDAVVNISTTQTRELPRGLPFPDLPEDSPFNQFFKRFFENRPDAPSARAVQSLGSGFVIAPDGYILTNAHVVQDAEQIIVRLSDRREVPADLVGLDPRSDVALLKIKLDHLRTVKIGDSDKLKVGQWVLAIGSPFGLEHTATQGIISALDRSLPDEAYVPFIQTDVAVNPGNSGGPLINASGRVIGINSQIYSNTGGYMGLSFAIPIDVAMRVAEEIKTTGHVTRGWLGVRIQPVNQNLAKSFGLDRPRGALVSEVEPHGAAAEAGLKPGDIILRYNDIPIEQSAELPPLVGETSVGAHIPLEVLRKGERVTLNVTIKPLTDLVAGENLTDKEAYPLHMSVAELTQEQRLALNVAKGGVLVTSVDPGPAAEAGLRPGDVIIMLNGHSIDDVADLIEQVKSLPAGTRVPVLVRREEGPLFLALQLPSH